MFPAARFRSHPSAALLAAALVAAASLVAAPSGPAGAQGVVVPNAQSVDEGDSQRSDAPFDFPTGPSRFMQVYAAEQFAPDPIRILGLRLRPDASQSAPVGAALFPDVEILLSTTDVAPGALSAGFDANVGDDVTLVYAGPLVLSTANQPGTGSARAFDVHVPLQSVFAYDPGAGHLLLEIRNFGSGHLGPVDAQSDGAGLSVELVSVTGDALAPNGSVLSEGVVTRFQAVPDGRLYACSEPALSTYTVDQKTGAATLVGPIGFPIGGPVAMASDRDSGMIWGLRNSSTGLWAVDPETGAWSLIGFSLPLLQNPGLAYDPEADLLYATHQITNLLYSIDPATGLRTSVGLTPRNVSGLAFDPDERILYGASSESDALYVLDPATGAGTLVGPLGLNVGSLGLAWDWQDDTLYMVENLSDALYEIDVTTGAATQVGATGVNNLPGLAYVPEPSLGSTLIAGLLSLACRSRGRGAALNARPRARRAACRARAR